MSLYTTILSLFKYNLDTDGKNTYNIQLALNDNWDKIDAFAKSILANVETVKETITTKFNELNSTKTDLNLSNVTKNGVNSIINYILPDTQSSSAVDISNGFIAPCNGWVYVNVRGYSGGRYKITLNGYEMVNKTSDGGLCSGSLSMLILKGDVIGITGKVNASFRPTLSKLTE